MHDVNNVFNDFYKRTFCLYLVLILMVSISNNKVLFELKYVHWDLQIENRKNFLNDYYTYCLLSNVKLILNQKKDLDFITIQTQYVS